MGDHLVDPLAEAEDPGTVPLDHRRLHHPLDVLVAAVGDEGLPVPQVAGVLILRHQGVQPGLYRFRKLQGPLHDGIPLQQLDGGPVGGEVGPVGVVVEQLPHAVVDVVGVVVVEVVGLDGHPQVHLPVGGMHQLLDALAGAGGDGDHRHPQLL